MANEFSARNIYNSIKKFFKILFGVLLGYLLVFLGLILLLKWVNPPFTAFTLQEDWEELNSERYNLRDYWVPDKEIPEHLKLAAISSEDQRFWEHWGVDIQAIAEAMEENDEEEKRRGASTITQQVAKNLFLPPSKTYIRKGVEALTAVIIEVVWPKERILEVYLNIAEFGPAVFGIGKASDAYFNKAPIGLVPQQSAQLAAVLPSPKRMQVEPPTPFVEERREWILRQMTHLSGISYLPRTESFAAVSDTSSFQADTSTVVEYAEPQIGRARVPDSLIRITDRDPIIDSDFDNGIDAW